MSRSQEHATTGGGGDGVFGGGIGGGNHRAMQLEAIKAQLLKVLSTLRSFKEGGRGGGGSVGRGGASATEEHGRLSESLAAQLTDCEQVGAGLWYVGVCVCLCMQVCVL